MLNIRKSSLLRYNSHKKSLLIQQHQDDYYRVLGEADKQSDSTCFIDFILKLIAQALKEGIENS
ncbi:hypothetical protein EHE21_14920 [Proteus sp. GOKU]|uniref:hypothetical protein n=1 Tax=Proteus TaxID=583 RepID=UPI001892988E|nr:MULTISPECIES: hypothetical protein [Proteus]QPB80596.1 hypothetical protein EHE21_14920 [Proteus sp. GOKU]QQP26603.1 hypothetical protein D7029_14920 [Proteus vulgaris]